MRVQDRSEKKIEIRERLALRNKVKEEEHIEMYGGLREEVRTKTYLHGQMDCAKMLKLRFRLGDLDLPERRKRYTSSSRGEEAQDAQMYPCGKAVPGSKYGINVKYTNRNEMCYRR